MSGQRTSARGIERLRDDLSGRDLAIIGQVADLRLMNARQIAAVHFPIEQHESALSAARTARRVLERLDGDRLLVRVDRRIGGVRAGSGSWLYACGPVGHRVLALSKPRPRYHEPSRLFAEHTLAIGDLVVGLTLAARSGACELLSCQAEPWCWREFSGRSGRVTLKPDLFVALGIGEYEHRWFMEVDRGTEHLPTLVRKCRTYSDYYRGGREQERHGFFPKVCLVVPSGERVGQLRKAIVASHALDPALFVVTTNEHALGTLTGGET